MDQACAILTLIFVFAVQTLLALSRIDNSCFKHGIGTLTLHLLRHVCETDHVDFNQLAAVTGYTVVSDTGSSSSSNNVATTTNSALRKDLFLALRHVLATDFKKGPYSMYKSVVWRGWHLNVCVCVSVCVCVCVQSRSVFLFVLLVIR